MSRPFSIFRSIRIRIALLVGVLSCWVAYQTSQGNIEGFVVTKRKQFTQEIKNATYDILHYLQGIHYIDLIGDPINLSAKKTQLGEFDGQPLRQAFAKKRNESLLGWALLDRNHRLVIGTSPPDPKIFSDSQFWPLIQQAPPFLETSATETLLRFPKTEQIAVEYLKINSKTPALNVAFLNLREGYLLVWMSMENIERRVRKKWIDIAKTAGRAGLVSALFSWFLIHLALIPTRRITRMAKNISAKKLDERIPDKFEPIEFEELIRVFNQMLDRLAENFKRISEFSDNASHELKTPLTVLQAQLEVSLNQTEDGSDEQFNYMTMLEEVQKLIQLTDTLLLLSSSDRKSLVTRKEKINVSETAESVFELIQLLDADLIYQSQIEPNQWIEGDPQLVRQMIMNLATNAIRHNRQEGRVLLQVANDGDWVKIVIENTGEPIPEDRVKRIFDRFYRADPSRSRETGGQGLGLNLASEIAKSHEGQLALKHNKKDCIQFLVTLPRLNNNPS